MILTKICVPRKVNGGRRAEKSLLTRKVSVQVSLTCLNVSPPNFGISSKSSGQVAGLLLPDV
jgi:hypothetical protein